MCIILPNRGPIGVVVPPFCRLVVLTALPPARDSSAGYDTRHFAEQLRSLRSDYNRKQKIVSPRRQHTHMHCVRPAVCIDVHKWRILHLFFVSEIIVSTTKNRNRFSLKRIHGLALPLPRDPAFETWHRQTARARLAAGISSAVANVNNLIYRRCQKHCSHLVCGEIKIFRAKHGTST